MKISFGQWIFWTILYLAWPTTSSAQRRYSDEELRDRAARHGFSREKQAKPSSALSWIKPGSWVGSDGARNLDVGPSLMLLESQGKLFRGSLQGAKDRVGVGAGIDIGQAASLVGFRELAPLTIFRLTVGINYSHSFRTDRELIGGYLEAFAPIRF